MGCNETKAVRGSDPVDYRNIRPTSPSYPFPKAPKRPRADVYRPEQCARVEDRAKNVPVPTLKTYESLLKHLHTGTNTDVERVRAIYVWLGTVDLDDPSLETLRPGDTPQNYIKTIKDGEGDFITFFTILCRKSGIPCVIIDGISKGGSYSIGTPERDMGHRWNAVYCDGEWRLVNIDYGILGLDSKVKKENPKPINQINDFYFMPDPEEYVAVCFPEDYRWQLLDSPYTKKEFMSIPNIKPEFFEWEMFIAEPKTGTVKAIKGRANIEIVVAKKNINSIKLHPDLHLMKAAIQRQNSEDRPRSRPRSVPPKLDKYVFMERKPGKFSFDIMLPTQGRYLFDIYGEKITNTGEPICDRTLLCQFRLLCEGEPDDFEPLPDLPEMGWGPGPRCSEIGLIPKTYLNGVIFINPGEKKDINFNVTEELEIKTKMLHNYIPEDQLQNHVTCSVLADKARLKVSIPELGQYALKIYAQRPDDSDPQEVCTYLLKQHNDRKISEKVRNKMLRARLEYNIQEGPSEESLRDALFMFQCYNVPDHGEIERAKHRLKFYWTIKRELNDSCKRRNFGVLKRWIDAAHKSKFSGELQDDVKKAEDCQAKLGKLGGYTHPVARIEAHTIEEIRSYARPKPVIHDIMSATYILLGEKKDDVEDWTYIQTLLSKTGRESLQHRILDRNPEDIPERSIDVADVKLEPHNLSEARAASNGAATFYKWAKNFINQRRSRDTSRSEQSATARSISRDYHKLDMSGTQSRSRDNQNLSTIDSQSQSRDDRNLDVAESQGVPDSVSSVQGSAFNVSPTLFKNGSSTPSPGRDQAEMGHENEESMTKIKYQASTPSPKRNLEPKAYAGYKAQDGNTDMNHVTSAPSPDRNQDPLADAEYNAVDSGSEYKHARPTPSPVRKQEPKAFAGYRPESN